ncbi:MAG: YaeQ family protein [Deltaproteobacteria bacterium]|nr:YaeQ family protein [Deltaproteobacteria bacterium]
MTFVDGFYSFNLDISDTERGLYQKTRVKTPKHPHESVPHLLARVLAFAHCYESGLSFSRGLFADEEPTLWKRDALGTVQLWIQVGEVNRKKLQKSLRQQPQARHILYFYEPAQVEALYLQRGKINGVETLTCHLIDGAFLDQLAPHLKSASNWQITFIDDLVYLTSAHQELQTKLVMIDLKRHAPLHLPPFNVL